MIFKVNFSVGTGLKFAITRFCIHLNVTLIVKRNSRAILPPTGIIKVVTINVKIAINFRPLCQKQSRYFKLM